MKLFSSKTLILMIFLAISLSACAGGGVTAASSWPGIIVEGETAYLSYNQHVYAINISDGKEKWRFPSEANSKISFYAAPILTSDGQLLAGGYDHVLYSLDPEKGTENWSFKEAKNRYVGSPLASETGIFAPTADDHLYALDLKGQLSWSFQTQGAQWAAPVTDPGCKCVYLASMDHRLYAIDSQTGKAKWQTNDLGGSMVGTPAYSPDGMLYIGTFNSEMVAVNAESGGILWQKPTDGWVWGGPALKEGKLYFGDLSGSFYAMETNGSIDWKIKPDGPIAQTPLLAEEAIYFTTQAGSIYAIDYAGKIRWNQTIGGKLYTRPALAGDKILVAPTGLDAYLIALDTNGTQVWQFIPEKK